MLKALQSNIKKVLGENLLFKFRILTNRFSPKYKAEQLKRELFYKQFISKNDLCFDVGPNLGNRNN